MRKSAVLILMVALQACSNAGAAVAARVEAFGFASDGKTIGAPGVAATPAFEKSERIPARVGVRFGILYSLSGLPPSRDVVLRKVITHPSMKLPDGKVVAGAAFDETHRAGADGKVANFTGFVFEKPHERVPGDWKVEVWLDTERLVEQRFSVVADATAAVACESGKLPAGYPQGFPFVKGGARFENAAIPGAFVYSLSDKVLVDGFAACLKQGGWSVKVQPPGEPHKAGGQTRIAASRGNRQVSAAIFASGASTFLVLLE